MENKESQDAARSGTLRLAVMTVVLAVVLFGSAGTLVWTQAWIYVLLLGGLGAASMRYVHRRQPDLLHERKEGRAGMKSWDRVLMPLIAIVGPLSMLIVAGLDRRLGWTGDLPLAVPAVGFGLICVSLPFVTWAMAVNPFFSAVVRIQEERGHVAITKGPYAVVRHPGYAGSLIFTLAVPLALGSFWTFVPSVLTVLVLIVRTALEDAALRRELDGYADYAASVRSRLIPGIW